MNKRASSVFTYAQKAPWNVSATCLCLQSTLLNSHIWHLISTLCSPLNPALGYLQIWTRRPIGSLYIRIMLITYNYTNIFSLSCKIFLSSKWSLWRRTRMTPGTRHFFGGFLHSETLKCCFTWWSTISLTLCNSFMRMNLWARLADIAHVSFLKLSEYFHERPFWCFVSGKVYCAIIGRSQLCLCWVTDHSVALAMLAGLQTVFIGGEVISGLVLMVCPGTFEPTTIWRCPLGLSSV